MTVYTPLIPNDELVAAAWLAAIDAGFTADQIATTLPKPPWLNNLFVQIMQVNGTADRDVPVADPVVSVNVFAMAKNSLKPPWAAAAQVAQQIWLATFTKRWQPDPAVELAMPAGYGRAVCRTVSSVSGRPRRVQSDPSQFAVYNLDLAFSWIPASVVIL